MLRNRHQNALPTCNPLSIGVVAIRTVVRPVISSRPKLTSEFRAESTSQRRRRRSVPTLSRRRPSGKNRRPTTRPECAVFTINKRRNDVRVDRQWNCMEPGLSGLLHGHETRIDIDSGYSIDTTKVNGLPCEKIRLLMRPFAVEKDNAERSTNLVVV